jgi:hypothetical protein
MKLNRMRCRDILFQNDSKFKTKNRHEILLLNVAKHGMEL